MDAQYDVGGTSRISKGLRIVRVGGSSLGLFGSWQPAQRASRLWLPERERKCKHQFRRDVEYTRGFQRERDGDGGGRVRGRDNMRNDFFYLPHGIQSGRHVSLLISRDAVAVGLGEIFCFSPNDRKPAEIACGLPQWLRNAKFKFKPPRGCFLPFNQVSKGKHPVELLHICSIT